ncbi:putative Krueppel-like 1 isoform X2 [Penaeus vannamei]|uniref:Putative Krueppel-like 1 isoform X2 n=1 Tax=Penaeus vannamei TaxID=6689 RepID=A0A423TQ37_PENVA|nr:putative Krueppel-like 1 isoform X2 [Penaeus vannamei]
MFIAVAALGRLRRLPDEALWRLESRSASSCDSSHSLITLMRRVRHRLLIFTLFPFLRRNVFVYGFDSFPTRTLLSLSPFASPTHLISFLFPPALYLLPCLPSPLCPLASLPPRSAPPCPRFPTHAYLPPGSRPIRPRLTPTLRERPYKCHLPDCGRAFIQLSNLQQHLRNHDAQLERMKNRPFHCNICGKGFATESSLRTHTSKHAALVGGPNAVNCPQCQKLFMNGEQLMEHMKYTHRDPNASGVAAKRRTASHSCPVCGKHYVNEGSLRKHLACHPETSQFTSSLRMWPCSVCHAVFTHESGLLNHMEHMRMDPKHQFAAQYVLSRAAAERRERESILGLAQMQHQVQHQAPMSMAASPSTQSDASSRMSTPAEKLESGIGRMPSPSDALRSISSHHDVMNHMRPHPTDNMRAMISQSQAELVKSTLTSQAESIRNAMASQAEVIPNHEGRPSPQHQGEVTDALRLQEMRMEHALRLHGDPRALPTSLPGPLGFPLAPPQHQPQQQSA